VKRSHIIALLIIAVSVGIIISMTGESSSYETFASASLQEGHEYHVIGHLSKDKPMYYEPEKDPNYFSFYMIDKNNEERKVVYIGAKPHDFERSEQIVLIGAIQGEDFHASSILMKCPSKYVEEEVQIAAKA